LKTVDASCNPQKEAGILPYIEPVIVWWQFSSCILTNEQKILYCF
jgi:hypothetical protein